MSRKLLSVLIVLVIVGVGLGAFVGTLSKSSSKSMSVQKTVYQCPMHPEVISDKPGNCPICGMTLVKKSEETKSTVRLDNHVDITISPERRQLIGVKSDAIRKVPLISTIHVAGHVAYNPDAFDTAAEYRDAFQLAVKTKRSASTVNEERAQELLELTAMKMRLAGFNNEQAKQIFATGIDKRFLQDYGISQDLILPDGSVWVYADVYEPDSELVDILQKVKVTTPALPGKVFEGTIKTVDPLLNAMTRTIRARIEIPQSDHLLRAGMSLDVHIEVPLGEKLSVLKEAVFHTGTKELVFVEESEGRILPREVNLGYEADGYYEVIDGLSEGEQVITSAGFLIDSESRLQAAVKAFGEEGQTPKTGEEAAQPAHRH